MINLEKVQENRKWMIKFALDNNTFNLYAFSQMFEVKTSVLLKDIEELYGSDYEYENNPDITAESLIGFRDMQMKRMESSMSKDDILVMMGMWHQPVQVKTLDEMFPQFAENVVVYGKTNELRKIGEDYLETHEITEQLKDRLDVVSSHIEENLLGLQRGLSKADIQRQYDLSKNETARLGDIAQMCGLEKTPERQLLRSDATYNDTKEIVNNVKSISRAADLIGINQHTLKTLKSEDIKISRTNSRIEQRRELIYQMYHEHGTTDGRTFTEIGKELNLSRATVEADLRIYKRQHPELIDETQLYRPRHAGMAKYQLKQERKAAILKAYESLKDNGLSVTELVTEIMKTADTSMPLIYSTLREADLIPTILENERNDISEMEHEAKVAFDEKGQFGRGSTRTLLNEKGLSTTGPEVKNERYKILRRQKKTMIEIRKREENRAAFNQKGSLIDVLNLCQQNDNSPIGRIQEEREAALNMGR